MGDSPSIGIPLVIAVGHGIISTGGAAGSVMGSGAAALSAGGAMLLPHGIPGRSLSAVSDGHISCRQSGILIVASPEF